MDSHFCLSSRLARSARVLGILLVGACLLGADAPRAAKEPPKCRRGVLIRFEGPITPMLEQYVYRNLEKAQGKNADLVIIEIDSPGGYVRESLAIAERLRDLDWAHTVAYVPGDGEAISGAAIMALGCDEIIMDPNASFGDAGPIYQGEDSLFRHAPEKIRSYLREKVRGLAEAKGRPPAVAEAMVDMELTVFRVRNRLTGEETFMEVDSEGNVQAPDNPEDWEKLERVPESGNKKFLTVDGARAVELRLAEGNAESRADLKKRYSLQRDLLVYEWTAVDWAVTILNSWPVTGLLFVIGLIALYIEFSAPGISVGGLVALLCFALFFWSRFMGGTAELLELTLFLAGLAFLAVEIFVLPGFGVAGLTGILLLLVSVVMASVSFTLFDPFSDSNPHTSRDLSDLSVTLLVVMLSGGVFAAAAALLSKRLPSMPLLNRLALLPTPDTTGEGRETDVADDPSQTVTHFRPEIGDVAIADSALRPAGRARFGDQFVDVVTEGAFVTKGQPVKVIEIHGNRIVVDLDA